MRCVPVASRMNGAQITPLLENFARENGGGFVITDGTYHRFVPGADVTSPESAILLRVERADDPLFSRSLSDRKLLMLGAATSGIAHDINNMLSALSGYVELADGAENAASRHEHLGNVSKVVRLLAEICNRVLRLGSLKEEVVPLNLKQVVGDVISLSKHLLNKSWRDTRVIHIDDNVDGALYCNAILPELQACLMNIILNAIRHGFRERREGTITFNSTAGGGRVLLDVANDGMPVPEDIREELLKRPLSAFCDNGYGLYTAAQGLRRFGGDLAFSSNDEKTTFTLSLPMVVP